MENLLVIYQTESINDLPEISDIVNELNTKIDIKIQESHIPAFNGSLAGMAIEFLMSDNIQGIKTAIEIGGLFIKLIQDLRKIGKKYRINKRLAKYLALFRVSNNDVIKNNKTIVNEPVVWGPMLIEPLSNVFFQNSFTNMCVDASGEQAYLIAIAFQKEPKRIKTIWSIIDITGETIASWSTQTLEERAPDFFKKHSNS